MNKQELKKESERYSTKLTDKELKEFFYDGFDRGYEFGRQKAEADFKKKIEEFIEKLKEPDKDDSGEWTTKGVIKLVNKHFGLSSEVSQKETAQ